MMNELFKYLLENSRGFTEEESKRYADSIRKMYKPTGRNIFDITEEMGEIDGQKDK